MAAEYIWQRIHLVLERTGSQEEKQQLKEVLMYRVMTTELFDFV